MSTRLTVTRFAPPPDKTAKDARERGRRMVSEAETARAAGGVAAALDGLRRTLAARDLLPDDVPASPSVVAAFEAAYARRPRADNTGGAMRNNAFWLFAVAHLLRPELIVESGTWLGFSSWLMAEAAPNAAVVTFDVQRLTGRIGHPRVRQCTGDWADDPSLDRLPARTLLYFDDHLPHLRRLEEAAARGGRLALFDDDYPAHALYATGTPPVPTVAMLTDPALVPARPIVWERDGKRYETMVTKQDRQAAGRLIAWTAPMPDLTPVNRYVQQGPATLVGLAPS